MSKSPTKSKSKSVANQYAHSLYRNNIFQKKLDSHLNALQQQSIKKQRVIEFRQFTYDMRMKSRKEEWDRNEFSETRQEQKKFIEVMLAREQADLQQKAKLAKFAKERKNLVDKKSDLNYLLDKYFNQSRSQGDEEWKHSLVPTIQITDSQTEGSQEEVDHSPNISSESSEKSQELLVNDSETSLRIHSIAEKMREEKERAKRKQQILKFEKANNLLSLETTKVFSKNIDELKFTFKKKSPDKEPPGTTKHKVVIIDPKDKVASKPARNMREFFIKKVNQVRIINRFRIQSRLSSKEKSISRSSGQDASEVVYSLQTKRNSKQMIFTEINTDRIPLSKLQPLATSQGSSTRSSFATSTPVRTAQFSSKIYNSNNSIHALKKQHEITQANVQKNALNDKRFLDLVTSLKEFWEWILSFDEFKIKIREKILIFLAFWVFKKKLNFLR